MARVIATNRRASQLLYIPDMGCCFYREYICFSYADT